VVDGNGLPLAAHLTAGQTHESTVFADLLDEVSVPQPSGQSRRRPQRVAGDKAYSVKWIRDWLRGKGIGVTIPRKSNERRRGPFDKQTYKQRNVVERCIGWLKECRAVATRYDKLARNYLAILKLAMIRRYLRIGFSETA
jgi:transposase